ncbi:methyltransferase domain-containing protein [Shewanella benthica]|uniref:class I SAM-dependent methyltransferase n=1 Tax=Shewanella benthica TaxID=43661 RepID=UPI00187AD9CF|nr:class I SAM-dependent methyltransferase [Shewanella benthica]MBE7214269.1 methyltransferase domain-containing protein [Shewanella benthica]MCL1062927.1 methyltransferase domain-containing protein [Shewanella benthica]
MNLFQEYEKQQGWRDWSRFVELIPLTANDTVIDLGCSVGDVSRMFSRQVKHVVGVDINDEFITFCDSRKSSNETFKLSDFLSLNYLEIQRYFGEVNGIWASYSLSYLSDPISYLTSLYSVLNEGGWIALLDVSCFISGNLAKDSKYYTRVMAFEQASYRSGLYDFDFGGKMQAMLGQAGFDIVHVDNDVSDPELNFSGAASFDVIEGWSARLGRMKKLRELLGEEYAEFCDEFLANLRADTHDKRGNVRFVVAKK